MSDDIRPNTKTYQRKHQSKDQKKERKAKVKRTSETPNLPTLTTPSHGESVIPVTVQDLPVKGAGGVRTWVVVEAPRRRVGNGHLIALKNSHGQTGPGLLTSVTELRQHWITWKISGGPEQSQIQIPIPWSDMTGIEAVAHARHFHTLPPIPAPHPNAKPPQQTNDNQYPYETSLENTTKETLESRLDEITKRKWEWRPEKEQKRRRLDDTAERD